MEPWRIAAIAEVGELFNLLLQNDFTAADLCDRLRGLLEFLELRPDQPTETCTHDPRRHDCQD